MISPTNIIVKTIDLMVDFVLWDIHAQVAITPTGRASQNITQPKPILPNQCIGRTAITKITATAGIEQMYKMYFLKNELFIVQLNTNCFVLYHSDV